MSLPKQWRHWYSDMRLKPQGVKRKQWLYLIGRGRHWRVNCKQQLQCGDTYAEFDRWAVCTIKESILPKTRAEFRETVLRLIAAQGEKHE